MNPTLYDLGDYYGDGGSWTGSTLLIFIGFILYLMSFHKLSKLLSLSIDDSVILWRVWIILPIGFLILFSIFKGTFSFSALIGLLVVGLFTYAIGGAYIDERRKKENLENTEND